MTDPVHFDESERPAFLTHTPEERHVFHPHSLPRCPSRRIAHAMSEETKAASDVMRWDLKGRHVPISGAEKDEKKKKQEMEKQQTVLSSLAQHCPCQVS